MIDKISSLGPEWKLQITVTISSLQYRFASLFEAFTQGDRSNYVARITLFHGFFHICVSTDKGSSCGFASSLSNKAYKIEINHILDRGIIKYQWHYQFKVDGKSILSVFQPFESKAPRKSFKNVEVYASSPFDAAPVKGVELNAYRFTTINAGTLRG